jgi:glycosyltransferase involved in cell wall biosynthesis
MRILLITHFFPPQYNAGTENYTLGLARTLSKKGHDIHVLCADGWSTGDSYWNGLTEEIYQGIKVHRLRLNWLKALNPNQVLYDSYPVESWLDGFLKENPFDLVHVTSPITLGVGIFRSVKRSNIPLVLTLTDFWFLCPSIQLIRSNGALCDGITSAQECLWCLLGNSHIYQNIQKLPVPRPIQSNILQVFSHIPFISKKRGFRGMLLDMEERKKKLPSALQLPDLILAPSKFVQNIFLQDLSLSIEVLQHGHDLTWLRDYQNKKSSDKLRFGYLGQIQATKGIHVLVQAFKQADFGEKATLDIWGDLSKETVYTQHIQEIIADQPSIRLRGRYDRDKLASILAEIDVLVVPSIWYENSPLVIQEAFAAKTPVIATNLGGMAEAVHHELNGLLFKRGDSEDLARQLQRVTMEDGLLGQLQEGIAPVKTVEQEVTELELIYKNLIGYRRSKLDLLLSV